MKMLSATVCTQKFHETLKLSACYSMLTEHIGYQPSGGTLMELRNCKLCKSTLAKTVYGEVTNDAP